MKKIFESNATHRKSANSIRVRLIAFLLVLMMTFGTMSIAFNNEPAIAANSHVANEHVDSNTVEISDGATTESSEIINATTYESADESIPWDDEMDYTRADDTDAHIRESEIGEEEINLHEHGYLGIEPLGIYTFMPYVIADRGEVYIDPVDNFARLTNVGSVRFRHNTIHTEVPGMLVQHRSEFNSVFNEWTELNAGATPPELYSFMVPVGDIVDGVHVLGIQARRQFEVPGVGLQWQEPRSSTILVNIQRTNSFVNLQDSDEEVLRLNRDASTAPNHGQAGFGHEPGLGFVNESALPGRQEPVSNPAHITLGRWSNNHPLDFMYIYGYTLPENTQPERSFWSIIGPNVDTGNVPLTGHNQGIDLRNDSRFLDTAFADTNVSIFVPGVTYTVMVRVQERAIRPEFAFPADPNIWSYSEATFQFDPPILTKEATPETVYVGDTVTYTIT
ncbi:MAG: hypothetical protein FWD05_14300, partial [Oscillospiraceae bacterium]|nr:hypothetical protein [Oscillospiraceae bacterium]